LYFEIKKRRNMNFTKKFIDYTQVISDTGINKQYNHLSVLVVLIDFNKNKLLKKRDTRNTTFDGVSFGR
jgi:hypothetical protein